MFFKYEKVLVLILRVPFLHGDLPMHHMNWFLVKLKISRKIVKLKIQKKKILYNEAKKKKNHRYICHYYF